MSALDRAIIRATLNGHVKFTDPIAHRFAMVGDLRLCRNLTERWHLVIADIDQVRLSLPAHLAVSIAARYANHGESK